jgi:hypothetical protein
MRWFRAYYDDESTYEGPHEMAPKTGIQTIIQENPRCGFEQLDGSHYYVLKGDRWFTATPDAFYFYLAKPGLKVVLFGEYIDDDRYNDIKNRATQDMKGLLEKSPHRLERNVAEREV